MELSPVGAARIWRVHEEEIPELCPVGDAVPGLGAAKCQSHSKGMDSLWILPVQG